MGMGDVHIFTPGPVLFPSVERIELMFLVGEAVEKIVLPQFRLMVQQHGLGRGLFQPNVHRFGTGVVPMVRGLCFPLDKGFKGALGIFNADDVDDAF